MTSTPAVKDFIMKDQLSDIYELVRQGGYSDMITMNMALYQWYQQGVVTEDEIISKSDQVNELKQMLRGVYRGLKS